MTQASPADEAEVDVGPERVTGMALGRAVGYARRGEALLIG